VAVAGARRFIVAATAAATVVAALMATIL
jgi:hypothetical protein